MNPARDAPEAAVPPVFLHIGAMKTGTTYLQRVLVDHQQQLAAAGYLFPGDSWVSQIRAAQDLAEAVPEDPVLESQSHGAWDSLVAQMMRHDGAGSIVSMEFLSHADPSAAGRAVSSVQPAPVHVILTVRDATAIIPAQWQTAIRNGRVTTWPDFRAGTRKAAGLRTRREWFADPSAHLFRRVQDVARMLDAWGWHVPSERIHVVTVPPSGSDPTLLWTRFAAVVGLDPGMGAETDRVNESLGYASAELLRRVNVALGPVPVSDYNAIVRGRLAGRVLSARSEQETRPLLDRRTYEFALRWNQRTREAVRRSGAHLVGDLQDLPVVPAPHHDGAVDDAQAPPSEPELLAAAEFAVERMRAVVIRRVRRAVGRGIQLAGPSTGGAVRGPRSGAGDPVAAAVDEIAELCRTAIDLRRRARA